MHSARKRKKKDNNAQEKRSTEFDPKRLSVLIVRSSFEIDFRKSYLPKGEYWVW